MGTAAASAGAAGPSQGLRAGWSSGRTEAGVPRGERITRLRTRADDWDSEPDYLLRPTRHGPDGKLQIIAHFLFRAKVTEYSVGTDARFKGDRCNDNFLSWRYFESVNKQGQWLLPLISAIIHIPCAVYSYSLATEEEI